MGVLSLPKTVLMMVVWAIPVLISLYFFQAFPLVIGLGTSGPVFVSAVLYNKTFKRFEPEEEELVVSDSEWSISEEEEQNVPEGTEQGALEETGQSSEAEE